MNSEATTQKTWETPLNPAAYQALRNDFVRIFRRRNSAACSTFWQRLSRAAKVTDLHFHDLRHAFGTWLQNLGVPLEGTATLLGHRRRGGATDHLAEKS